MRKSATVWFMGLPCSGKSTLAESLYRTPTTIHLDGDILRKGLCSDLGFSKEDRTENIRRTAHLAQFLNEGGHNVTASFITPSKHHQIDIRKIIDNLVLVYVKCPVDVCKERDVKGMYAKAEAGEIKDFTGVSAKFVEPANPDIILPTASLTLQECLEILKRDIPKYW